MRMGMSREGETWAGAAAIVARIPHAEAAREMAGEFESQMAAFEHLSEDSRADVVKGLQRTLRRWSRFVSTGVMSPDSDFDPLREWTRARAAEGVRLEDLLRSFGLAHQLGWQLLRRHARSDESEVLLELAAPLARYVDQVSAVVTETYLAERELLVSEEERRTRSLLDRLCVDSPLDAADSELADRLGVPVDGAYAPFAVAMPGRPPHSHAALAARLRRGGWRLAVTQSDCVVGLTWKPLELPDLGEGPDVILAIGEPTPRGELAAAREEVMVLAEHARRVGLLGRLKAEDHLLEILLERSPRLAGRLREKVLAPLAGDDHGELAHTLQTLIDCRLDRTATSAALHVHRNTLAYRLKRIEEITGLDLSSPRDLACVYVALARDPAGPSQP
ncbi:MAG TPA: helix-turn-helix domain-containing protein [Solirubrobacteraceae bacterium]|nr:helix-turn-helix domain-containing protein [Solirubrobacteraceae bacterium]